MQDFLLKCLLIHNVAPHTKSEQQIVSQILQAKFILESLIFVKASFPLFCINWEYFNNADINWKLLAVKQVIRCMPVTESFATSTGREVFQTTGR